MQKGLLNTKLCEKVSTSGLPQVNVPTITPQKKGSVPQISWQTTAPLDVHM